MTRTWTVLLLVCTGCGSAESPPEYMTKEDGRALAADIGKAVRTELDAFRTEHSEQLKGIVVDAAKEAVDDRLARIAAANIQRQHEAMQAQQEAIAAAEAESAAIEKEERERRKLAAMRSIPPNKSGMVDRIRGICEAHGLGGLEPHDWIFVRDYQAAVEEFLIAAAEREQTHEASVQIDAVAKYLDLSTTEEIEFARSDHIQISHRIFGCIQTRQPLSAFLIQEARLGYFANRLVESYMASDEYPH